MLKQRDPATQTLVQELRRRIEDGQYLPGAWLPTEREIAAEFAVRRAVVRAALASLAEREWIVRLPGRRPWVNERRAPVSNAQRPGRRSTQLQVIAAILPQHTMIASALSNEAPATTVARVPQHTLFAASPAILGGIQYALRDEEAPYRLVIFDNCSNALTVNSKEERKALLAVLDDGVAGVLLWSIDARRTLLEIQCLREQGVPVVFIDRYAPDWDSDFVGVDNRHAAQEAVRYLLDLGHRRIGYLAIDEADITTTTRERCQGYHETLQRRGLAAPKLVHWLHLDGRAEVSPADYFLGLEEPPTAVFANNDILAYGLIHDLERRGLRVPQDMSVIGFDDADRFSPRPARLTTLRQPFEQMGQRATELLLRRLQSGTSRGLPWQHILLPTPLIARETCCRIQT